jgi:hypothetical protein
VEALLAQDVADPAGLSEDEIPAPVGREFCSERAARVTAGQGAGLCVTEIANQPCGSRPEREAVGQGPDLPDQAAQQYGSDPKDDEEFHNSEAARLADHASTPRQVT